ncbi:acyl carrier protein [Streptomyces sp. NPDC051452]|uniref:acyl carrier protein n=1 Tax=Streptomyces sp. NPDC051452 TaxID=3365654 RepID=UPI0037B56E59
MTASTHRPTAPRTLLEQWLLDRLADYLHRPAETIDPTVPLAEYGADSVVALSLCGDLEDEWGVEADPTLLWDHPTVARLLAHLPAAYADVFAPGAR